MTLEQEFNNFFDQSYKSRTVSKDQKREIKMNFYSGAFIGSITFYNREINIQSKVWIESYIDERFKEERLSK